MNLIIIAALAAVTSAAKLDRAYLPPASAKTAGGVPGSLQPPLVNSIDDDVSRGLGGLPKGSYENAYQGVIVDAAAPGTRTSEEETGLGAPRISYGSMNSKVGVAAFTKQAPFKSAFGDLIDRPRNHKSQIRPGQRYNVRTGEGIHRGGSDLLMVNAGYDDSFNYGLGGKVDQGSGESIFSGSSESFDSRIDSGERFAQETGADFRGGNKVFNQRIGLVDNEPQRPMRARASIDRAANTVRFENNVGSESYSYAFETDNGISAEESGVAVNGVKAQGGYSYTGDDGQVYTVTYTADERGFQPKGAHLPTPPPIPEAILRSLEQNARDEAAGLMDDGSYDAQKYNEGSDYTETVDSNGKYNHQSSKFENTEETDATASGTFINQNNQAFPRPNKQGINNLLGSNLKKPALVGPTGQDVNAEAQFVSGFNQEAFILQKEGQKRPEYLPPKSGFGPNRVQGSRLGSVILNANKQQVDQSYTDIQNNTSETDAQINFLARPQDSSFNRPNSNGRQPTRGNGNSAISLQLGNSLRPSNNRENGIRPAIQLGFGKRKEYLPPKNTVNQNGRPAVNLKPQIPTGGFSSQSIQEYTDVQPTESAEELQSTFLTGTAFAANTLASFGQQSNGPSKRPMSSFNTAGKFSSISTQNHLSSGSSSLPSQAATSPPATELTTPLENSGPQYHASSNAQPASFVSSSLPDVKPTQSQFVFNTSAQSSASSSFGSKPTSQKPSPSFSTGQIQFTETQFGSKQPFETSDAQFSSSTLRPSITQQPQGPDSSYYYNQPAKPFQTSQGSRFSSSQSSQFLTETQTSNFQNQFSSQNGFESTRNPQSSSLEPVKPTSSSQSQSNGFSGITQASISPFPSETPTQSTQFSQQSQFSSRPSSSRPMQTQFGTSFGQSSTLQQNFESRPSQSQFSTNFGQSSTSQQTLKHRPTQSQFGSTFEPSSIQQSSESETSQPQFGTSFGQSPSSQQTFGSSSTQTQFGTSFDQSSTAQQSFSSQSSISPQRLTNGRQPVPQRQFGQFNKDKSDEGVTETVPTQQYDGEIYEYKKPAQTLPAPNHEDQEEILQDSEIFGQRMPSSSNKPTSQFSQSSSSPNNKTPFIQQDSEKSTTSQVNQVQEGSAQSTRLEFNHRENTFLGQKKYNTFLTQKQQNPQLFNNQPRPFGSSNLREQMKPQFGSNNDRLITNSCCQTSNAPAQGSQLSQAQNQFSSSFSSSQGFKPDSTTSSFAGKGEEFGGPRKPPSFDPETGYHY